jgi:hypothetical protein
MRPLLARTGVFFLIVALPSIVFDLVYWRSPLPGSLLIPTEVALRLTLVAFVAAWVEKRAPRPGAPLLVFVAAAATYAAGFIESEYLNAVLRDRTPESGLLGLAALKRRMEEHPRYFLIVVTIVATPFALASLARSLGLGTAGATVVCAFGTLAVSVLLLEPFRVEVGRVTAAFVCVRTLFCGLLLPASAHIAEKRRFDKTAPS